MVGSSATILSLRLFLRTLFCTFWGSPSSALHTSSLPDSPRLTTWPGTRSSTLYQHKEATGRAVRSPGHSLCNPTFVGVVEVLLVPVFGNPNHIFLGELDPVASAFGLLLYGAGLHAKFMEDVGAVKASRVLVIAIHLLSTRSGFWHPISTMPQVFVAEFWGYDQTGTTQHLDLSQPGHTRFSILTDVPPARGRRRSEQFLNW